MRFSHTHQPDDHKNTLLSNFTDLLKYYLFFSFIVDLETYILILKHACIPDTNPIW